MKSQNKILVFGKSFTLSFLVFIASIGANLMLFCILAAARTTPSLKYTETSKPMRIISLETPSSTTSEKADKIIATDIIQLNTKSTDTKLPEPVFGTVSPSFSSSTVSIEDVTFELPGLPVFSSAMSLQLPSGDVSVGGAVRMLSVSEVDILPSKTTGPIPQYPQWARLNKLEGTVTLRFIVTKEGKVEDINIREIEGDERFGTEALRAVSLWRFSPAIIAGKSVSCWCFQKIDFRFPR